MGSDLYSLLDPLGVVGPIAGRWTVGDLDVVSGPLDFHAF